MPYDYLTAVLPRRASKGKLRFLAQTSIRTGTEPRFAQHRYAEWTNTLLEIARTNPCNIWHSLPKRFCRLIEGATREEQENRLEVANIEDELIWLEQAISSPTQIVVAEMLAEEIAARGFGDYEWDNDSSTAVKRLGAIQLKLKGDEKRQQVHFEFEWLKAGEIHHQDVRKWLPTAKEKINSILDKAGWTCFSIINTGQLRGNANVALDVLRRDIEKHATSIRYVVETLAYT